MASTVLLVFLLILFLNTAVYWLLYIDIDTVIYISALFYNNCMYLSHQLIMLANNYKARLSTILDDVSSITFVDLVPLLRALGTEVLVEQLSAQKTDLLDCLLAADGKFYLTYTCTVIKQNGTIFISCLLCWLYGGLEFYRCYQVVC